MLIFTHVNRYVHMYVYVYGYGYGSGTARCGPAWHGIAWHRIASRRVVSYLGPCRDASRRARPPREAAGETCACARPVSPRGPPHLPSPGSSPSRPSARRGFNVARGRSPRREARQHLLMHAVRAHGLQMRCSAFVPHYVDDGINYMTCRCFTSLVFAYAYKYIHSYANSHTHKFNNLRYALCYALYILRFE